MRSRMQDITDILETLVDWFETIEEIELSDQDKSLLMQVAGSLSDSKAAAVDMGFPESDFEDWLRNDVLEQWSAMMEDRVDEDMKKIDNPVQAFHSFAKGGEQRLYLQMIKRCALNSELQTLA